MTRFLEFVALSPKRGAATALENKGDPFHFAAAPTMALMWRSISTVFVLAAL